MANRNRTEGIKWELSILNRWLKVLFPSAVTSRSESRRTDAKKVDFCFTGNWNFQAKSTCAGVNYHKLLNEMPDGHNVIVHKRTVKKGTQFYDAGHYVVMNEETFKILLTSYETHNNTKIVKHLKR